LPESGTATPVLVVVDADRQALTTTETAIVRRFQPDYRVMTADSPSTGLATLEQLASSGEDLALIAAGCQAWMAWRSWNGPKRYTGMQAGCCC